MVVAFSHFSVALRTWCLLAICVLACGVAAPLAAAVTAEAEATWNLPDQVTPQTPVSLTLVVKNFASAVSTYAAPQIAGATWEPGVRSSGSSTRIINGQRSSEQTFVLQITFDAVGTYIIPPFTVIGRDGSSVATLPTTLVVASGAVIAASECYAHIRLEPSQVVAGENVTLVYTVGLAAHKSLSITSLGITIPTGILDVSEGFTETKTQEHDSQGRLWMIAVYRKQYTVSAAGTYNFTGQQDYGQSVRRFIGSQFIKKGTVAVKPAQLTVANLPHAGQPADFQGLVGKVTIHATIDRERIALGEGVQLRLTLSDGQIDLISTVTLPTLPGFTVYSEDTLHDTDAHSKTKTFVWSLVPKKEGMYIIPEITIPYYDPHGKRYRAARSNTLALSVIPGRKRELGSIGNAPTTTHTPTNKSDGLNDNGIQMPAALYGETGITGMGLLHAHLSSTHIWLGVLYGALIAIALCALRLRTRQPNQQAQAAKQLRALVRAIEHTDMPTAGQLLHTLMPLLHPDTLATARSLEAAIEHARFAQGDDSGDSGDSRDADILSSAQALFLR